MYLYDVTNRGSIKYLKNCKRFVTTIKLVFPLNINKLQKFFAGTYTSIFSRRFHFKIIVTLKYLYTLFTCIFLSKLGIICLTVGNWTVIRINSIHTVFADNDIVNW